MKEERCIRCKGKMKKAMIKIDLPRGSAEIEGYKCTKCGDVIFTHEQAEMGENITMAKGIWGPNLWLERKVTSIGNVPAVVIPKDIAAHLHIKSGNKIKIGIMDDEIIIKPERTS
jgi:AbrB family looped-hinge helix DNA binding protein